MAKHICNELVREKLKTLGADKVAFPAQNILFPDNSLFTLFLPCWIELKPQLTKRTSTFPSVEWGINDEF